MRFLRTSRLLFGERQHLDGLREHRSSLAFQNANRVIQQLLGGPYPPGHQIETGQPHLRLRVVQRIHAHLPRTQGQQAFEFAGRAV